MKDVFLIKIEKSSTHKIGYQVTLNFKIGQHSRDAELMKSLVNYFNCGNYYPSSTGEYGEFVVKKLSDINEKIIPFFVLQKYPLQSLRGPGD